MFFYRHKSVCKNCHATYMGVHVCPAPCKHVRWKAYDCYCTFGPPSCTNCKYTKECADCGHLE